VAAGGATRRRWRGLVTSTSVLVDSGGQGVDAVRRQFSLHGIVLECCADAAEALFQIGRCAPGLVILRAADPVLPTAHAVSIVRRHGATPVVVAVGEGETAMVRPAFTAGASAIVGYPYRVKEIAETISRYFPDADLHHSEHAVVTVGHVELDGPAFEVRVQGRRTAMPLREFELLRFLMVNAGHVVTEAQIRAAVWEPRGDTVGSKTIALHARRLRDRLGDAVELVRVRGVGYRLTGPDAAVSVPSR
jgi:DNA-binding response OmpR family regulator